MTSQPLTKKGGKAWEKQITQKINTAIMENESDALDWALCSLSSELYWWTAFFNIAFFQKPSR